MALCFPIPTFTIFATAASRSKAWRPRFPPNRASISTASRTPAGAEAVSLDYPGVIGVRPFLGRWFQTEDEDACVISYRAWQRFFAADPNVLGKRVRSETQWYTVVGVAPKEFEGIYLPLSMDLWVPLRRWTSQHPGFGARMEDRGQPVVFAFGRLKPGVAPRQASAEINSIAAQLPRTETKSTPIVLEQVRGIPAARTRSIAAPVAGVLMAVVGVILLIACVNVGNLLIARGAARHREISVRVALSMPAAAVCCANS